MTVLVDTNVLLDVVEDDPVWAEWSLEQLERLSVSEKLVINPIIYAELSIGFARIEELDNMLSVTGLALAEIPRPALFLAGKAFQIYRKRGGAKAGVLPDFFIGAHAAVAGMSLLTRDTGRYQSYYPTLNLIHPED